MTDAESAANRVAALLDELSAGEPRVAAAAEELARALTELYGAALARVVATVDEPTLRALAGDDLVGALLVLHDLHPDDLMARVAAALDGVRPALGAHAGGVELLGIREEADGAVVELRLEGSCSGCPSSSVTIRDAIERAVLAVAPEVARVEAVESVGAAQPVLLQIEPIRPYAPDGSDCPAVAGAAP
jgi:Fe-S cluster biogenesis protein NfuA